MYDLLFQDETFDPNQVTAYDLIIQIGREGYAFTVFDPGRNKFIKFGLKVLEDLSSTIWAEKIHDWLVGDETFQNQWHRVAVVHVTSQSILVPEDYFDPNKLKTFFEASYYMNELDTIHYRKLSFDDIYQVFTVDQRVIHAVSKIGGKPVHYQQAQPVLERARWHAGKSGSLIIANIRKGYIDLVVLKEGNLTFINHYKCLNQQDMVYYILHAYQQANLDPALHQLWMAGDVIKNDDLWQLCNEYISQLKLLAPDMRYSFSYTIKEPAHRHLSLFNTVACA